MPFALLAIGVIIVIVAFHNTFGQLAVELEHDIPGYFVWAIAIVAILGLGYIPALRTPSRWLLALVAVVLLLTNYQQFIAGFESFAAQGSAPATPIPSNPPTQGFSSNPQSTAGPAPSAIAGNAPDATSAAPSAAAALNPYDPAAYLAAFGVPPSMSNPS
jgi:hypothetical protein